MKVLGGRIPPEAMWPAADPRFRVHWLELPEGERVRVVECGAPGAPAVVLFPGWASPAYVFRDLLPALAARDYHVVAAELRGHGLSDIPPDRAAYTADALARHVVQIVEALGFDSVVIGGHSLGAAHAARATPLLGERVRAQLLLSPVGTHGQPRRLLVGLLPTRLLRPVAPWLARRTVVRIVLRMAAARSGVYGPGDIDQYWAPSQFPAFGRAMLDLLTELDWGDESPLRAEDISVPTLVVYGVLDPLVKRTRAAIHLARSPLVTTVALPGVGHVVTDEAPVAVADAVLAFLATLP